MQRLLILLTFLVFLIIGNDYTTSISPITPMFVP